MLAAFVALSLHPDTLKKAQDELDAVVGPHRLPEFEDKESLVYVNAIIMETLRWHTVTPFAAPHCTIADEELRGYFIPKGTLVTANIWYVKAHPTFRSVTLSTAPACFCASSSALTFDFLTFTFRN